MVPTVELEPRTEDLTRFAPLRLNDSATSPRKIDGDAIQDLNHTKSATKGERASVDQSTKIHHGVSTGYLINVKNPKRFLIAGEFSMRKKHLFEVWRS